MLVPISYFDVVLSVIFLPFEFFGKLITNLIRPNVSDYFNFLLIPLSVIVILPFLKSLIKFITKFFNLR